MLPRPPPSTLFPYTTLFRSTRGRRGLARRVRRVLRGPHVRGPSRLHRLARPRDQGADARHQHRSEEHTSELQSRGHLVCRLLPEKKKSISVTLTTRKTSSSF